MSPKVDGMDCASCAATVERALQQLEGVQDVQVDVVGGRVRVNYAEGKLARGDLTGAVRRVGYTVQDADDRAARRATASMRTLRWRRAPRVIASGELSSGRCCKKPNASSRSATAASTIGSLPFW